MNFTSWFQRVRLSTWLTGNREVVDALKKAYEAGFRHGRKGTK